MVGARPRSVIFGKVRGHVGCLTRCCRFTTRGCVAWCRCQRWRGSIEPHVVDLQFARMEDRGSMSGGAVVCVAGGGKTDLRSVPCGVRSFTCSCVKVGYTVLYVPASSGGQILSPFPFPPLSEEVLFPFFKLEDKETSLMTTLRPLHLINNTHSPYLCDGFSTPYRTHSSAD